MRVDEVNQTAGQTDVETTLPLSGMRLQSRAADRSFRVGHPAPDDIVTEASEDELLWRPVRARRHGRRSRQRRGRHGGGGVVHD
ncbi:hypothetical protein [Nocardia blacklockiae]|uniref:hypothetical protein n=1 Tax=Nocardia blacklockiae TaxID=480036 RepID=UPI0018946F7A|nr:hypothetical protein [Nocardia blacklockiae]MBF6175159.1 hypothetical protein [Nocardia blacklockiae]